jgi:hypothetical protein
VILKIINLMNFKKKKKSKILTNQLQNNKHITNMVNLEVNLIYRLVLVIMKVNKAVFNLIVLFIYKNLIFKNFSSFFLE